MAFNTNLPTTDGTDFASDSVATPGTHWPYCKLVFGADGTATIVSTSNALPVVQTGALPAGTNNIGDVDVVSSVLPTGAATAALQLPNSHDVTIDNAAGASAVNIQDGGNIITVDGTVGVSGTVTVDTELPTALALADNMANPTAPAVGAFVMGWDGATWDRIQSLSGALGVSVVGTATVGGVAAHDSPVSGNPVLLAGFASTGAPTAVADGDAVRVWCSQNGAVTVWDGGSSITVDGTVTANAGTGTFTVGDGGGSLTIDQATAANLNAQVVGSVAHDAVAAGNPVLDGLRANTSEPATPVADGDATYVWGDRWGRVVVTLDHPPKPAAAGTHGPYSENSTASGDVELIAAPGASTSIVVTGFWISNQAATKNRVALREGAAGTIRYRGTVAADGGGIEKPPGFPWMLPANTALTINIGTAGDIDVNIEFYVQATS